MTTELDTRLRAAHAAVPEPDDAARARARARLEAAITAEPRSRRRLWLALPVAALAGAAAVAVVALTPTQVRTPVAPPIAEAAKVVCARPGAGGRCLRALSTVAGAQSALAAGQVFYQRNIFTLSTTYVGADGRSGAGARDAAYALTTRVPEEVWLAPDGSGARSYGEEDAPRPASTADERAWRAAGSPNPVTLMDPGGEWGPKHPTYGPGELDLSMIFNSNLEAVLPAEDPLSVLPHDPEQLATFLWEAADKQRNGGADVRNTFGTDVTTFLRYPRTPPDLRAALLQVFATLSETRTLGVIQDGAGRPAAALELPPDMNDGNNVIAFDPETSQLLAEGMAYKGSVRWNYVYGVSTGAVAKTGDRP
jgi:hypothetical protein